MLIKEFLQIYGETISYNNTNFSFNGNPDFFISKRLFSPETPIFFIREFKRAEEFSNPRPQLLAEMIAGLEISHLEMIRGAYIIGEDWYFVILEKVEDGSYRYFVSESFSSSDREKLKAIYKNLLFIKREILEKESNGSI
jgi:hypothetical protein